MNDKEFDQNIAAEINRDDLGPYGAEDTVHNIDQAEIEEAMSQVKLDFQNNMEFQAPRKQANDAIKKKSDQMAGLRKSRHNLEHSRDAKDVKQSRPSPVPTGPK